MAIFRSLTFDGVNSLDYGIYITGEAVYNAPERDVEMVTIPGKNGALALDQGRFENIEVTYHAGCFADNQADFAEKVMKFRNALASRYTYKRLTDEYHTDEYRLGLYKSGLEVDVVHYSTAGEFDITFDCKPQRFLTSGETALTPSDYIDTQTATGEIVTIDSDGSLGVKSLKVALEPIQTGSGTPSPDNVRPISGRDSVVTQRTGKNLLNLDRELGTPNPPAGSNTTSPRVMDTEHYYVGLRHDNYYYPSNVAEYSVVNNEVTIRGTNNAYGVGFPIEVKPNTQYRVSATVEGNAYLGVTYYDANWDYISYNNDVYTFTTPSNASYAVIILRSRSTSETATWRDVQVELGSTATDYEPYQGETYTTALGRTVYGGTLDVVTGTLTVDRKYMELSEDWYWIKSSSYPGGYFTTAAAQGIKLLTPFMCSHARTVTRLADYVLGTCYCDNSINIRIMDANSTLQDWKDYIVAQRTNGTPIQICCELAEPQTYQLTAQEIGLLQGENNVWSDAGEITVTYGVHPYYNPSPFDSKPLIKVTGTGTIGIGEYILTITGSATQTLYIDCETMEIYTIEGTVPTGASSLVSINKNDFPVLKPGINNISVGSGITAVTITPRWWRI